MRLDLPYVDMSGFGGVDTLRSPDQLEASAGKTVFQDLQGVVPIERGRPRSCWEGESAEATFSALIDGTSSVEEAPQHLIYWQKAGQLAASNRYRAQVADVAQLLIESEDGDAQRDVHLIEYAGHLWCFADKMPLRFYMKEDTSASGDVRGYARTIEQLKTTNMGAAGTIPDSDDFYDWFNLKGEPCWVYHDYWTLAAAADAFDSGDKITGTNINAASGATGSGMAYTNTPYVTTLQLFDSAAKPILTRLRYPRVVFNDGATDVNSVYAYGDIDDSRTDRFVRAGRPNQQAMLRFPSVHKDRLIAVEGREYAYTNLECGLASFIDAQSATELRTAADVDISTNDVAMPGDEIIVFHNGSNQSLIMDYVFTGQNELDGSSNPKVSGPFQIRELYYDSGVSRSRIFLGSGDDVSGLSTGMPYVIRRKLTDEDRRTIYCAGRPATTASGISQDITDAAVWETNNSFIVGNDEDGDITGTFSQNDGRLIIGLEKAIFQQTGGLPIGGFLPPDFSLNRIGDVGLYKHTAITSDSSGQTIYFCSGDGIHRIYGNSVEPVPVSAAIQGHADYIGKFSHLAFDDANNLLYCQTDATDPAIFTYDTIANEWYAGNRVNSGQDQTGTLAALQLSDGSYASNKIYESGDAGGIFSPYRRTSSEDTRVLVCYKDTSYKVRTLNYSGDIHNHANLLWGGKAVTGHIQGGNVDTYKLRRLLYKNTLPMLDNGSGSTFNEMQFSATGSEGGITLSRDITPKRSETDFTQYEVNGATGRGDSSMEITLSDGITPLGQLASVRAYIQPKGDRG